MKAFHVVFMVTWFAGLFYLPRLFVYHAGCGDAPGHERFRTMERKLFWLMTIGAALTITSGAWLTVLYGGAFFRGSGWLHAKITLVALLVAYHAWCWVLLKRFAEGRNRHSHRWYRWFNEVPAVLLIAIVVLAIVKP